MAEQRVTTRTLPWCVEPGRLWGALVFAAVTLLGCASGGIDSTQAPEIEVAASAGDTNGATAEIVETPEAVEPVAAPTPTVGAPDTSVPDLTPPLEAVYDSAVDDGGWPVPAGTWASSSFSTPIRFKLPVDATLLSDGLGRLEFRVGPADDPQGWISIVEPTAVNRPAGPIPIDLVDADTAFDGAIVLEEVTAEGALGTVTDFDFQLDSQPTFEPFLGGCFRRPGLRCIEPFWTESGPLVAFAVDRGHRVSAMDFGEEGRLYVLTSAADSIEASFFDYGSAMALSIDVSVPDQWLGARSLDSLGMDAETIPAGRWLRFIGSTAIAVDVETELPVTPLVFPTMDTIGVSAYESFLFLVELDVRYDLATGKLPADAAPWAPPTWNQVEDAITAAGGIVSATADEFAGWEAVRFEVVFDDGVPCPRLALPLPVGTLCSTWFRSSGSEFHSFTTAEITQTLSYIEELGIIASASVPVGDDQGSAALAEFEDHLELMLHE